MVTTTVRVTGTVAIVVVPARAIIIATSVIARIHGTNQILKIVPRGVAKRTQRKLYTAGRMRGKETGFAMPAITSAAATGMVAIAVAVVSVPNTAISTTAAASAWTPASAVGPLRLQPRARARQNPIANFLITRRMVIVMISTTFASATGTGGIAAEKVTTMVFATLVSARTQPRSPWAASVAVLSKITKATSTAMTKTIIAVVTGTVVTAASSRMVKCADSPIARRVCASIRTLPKTKNARVIAAS